MLMLISGLHYSRNKLKFTLYKQKE